jgi:hypothetical protein
MVKLIIGVFLLALILTVMLVVVLIAECGEKLYSNFTDFWRMVSRMP